MNWGNEYDNLRPAADLVTQLQEQISRWLDEPIDWTRKPKNLEEREASLDRIRRFVSQELHRLVQGRLADKPRSEWREAYRFQSKGSALQRAEKVKGIYQTSAPQISSAMMKPAREFLDEVKTIVAAAVEASGGQIRWSNAA